MHLADPLALFVMPSHTPTETLAIILRWVHFLAGITWIGLLYFFNLVNVPFMKSVDAAAKPNVFKNLTLPALWWFRWSAVVTVFVGFWYWAQMYVAVDAARENASPWGTIGLFLLVWFVAWFVEYAVILKFPANGWVVAILNAIIFSIASWVFVHFVTVGRDDNHVLAIGVGGGMGLLMMLNVWSIIWRANKAIINGALGGTPPANGAVLARQAFLASRTNAWLSIPMLFFMASSYHYVILGS
jgi:uncharacterized membrane protein